jgi:flagellar biosynthetic protein FliR
MAQIKTMLALFLYAATGGHLVLLAALAGSLRQLPPGSPVDLAAGAQAAATLAGTLFACAIAAAAPVMVTLLLVNAALAMLNRAVPQLNAMLVSLPVSVAVGLVTLALALPGIAGVMHGWMTALPGRVADALGAFAPAP